MVKYGGPHQLEQGAQQKQKIVQKKENGILVFDYSLSGKTEMIARAFAIC